MAFEQQGMELRNANLAVLATVYPTLAAALQDVMPADDIDLSYAKSGAITAVRGAISMHSRHDPELEARRLIETGTKHADLYVVEGFGLGYAANALLELRAGAQIVIVEPDVRLFSAVLCARDLSTILGSSTFEYVLGTESADAVSEILSTRNPTSVEIVRFRPFFEPYREYFAAIESHITTYVTRTEVNQNTLIRFGRLWVRNLTRNLPLFREVRPLSSLDGIGDGRPGVLLGGGPSLDEILPALPEIARRCIVVAVDTSLSACRRSGVEPDFVVVVDPQYWNTRHLDGETTSRTPLISESSTHPRVFRSFEGDIYFCGSLFPLGEYIESHLGKMGNLGAGGSVSTSAWDFLRILGCSPIYIAGVDLGFPHRQTHFRGSYFEERILTLGNRMEPGELHAFRYLNDASPFSVPDNAEGTVLTDRRMLIYRTWFEGQAHRFPDCDTRNLSRYGVRLNGIPYAPNEEILSLPPFREGEQTSGRAPRVSDGTPASRTAPVPDATLLAAVEALRADLLEIEAVAERGLKLVRAAEDALARSEDIVSHLDLLNRLDREIAANPHRDIVGFLMQESVRELTGKAHESVTAETVLANSRRIYESLLDSARFHRECLKSGVARTVPS